MKKAESPARAKDEIIGQRTAIQRVTDLDLAIALMSAGVPLRTDPPFTAHKLTNGHTAWVFNFHLKTADGKDKTEDLIEAYRNSDKFIAENPGHVFTGAICALKNRAKMMEIMKRVKPWVAYSPPGGGPAVLCLEGSQRQARYIKKGWKRCDPFEKR